MTIICPFQCCCRIHFRIQDDWISATNLDNLLISQTYVLYEHKMIPEEMDLTRGDSVNEIDIITHFQSGIKKFWI